MKTIIVTLNSKFIHSSLSIRYLKSYCEDVFPDIKIAEYTINQGNDYITGEIFKQAPDIVAFSCYIWNIKSILEISERLKIVKPDVKIILGGPEVSYDGADIMKKHFYIDFIIYGEGEETFRQLLINLNEKVECFSQIKGLIFRDGENIIQNECRPLIDDLDTIPSPFKGDMKEFNNKIVYYESSRGCPFNCQFCLSSTIKGLRFFSLNRVKSDLLLLIKAKVKQVKFVDRTFNARKDYALEIMKFIMDNSEGNTNFHFEVTAHLLDEEILEFLKNVPEGLFQFEIGVQSTNPKTIKAINRATDFEKLAKVVRKIKSYRNIHQHLDLIAGLPYEDYESFKKSFNDVYNLRPDKLQLGFLKLLKGSGLREKMDEYEFKYLDSPPYEVLENKNISYKEMLRLKIIEDLVEKYGNDIGFQHSLDYIIQKIYERPFDFYEKFSEYWEKSGFHHISHGKLKLYRILYDFYSKEINSNTKIFNELLKFDLVYNNKNVNIPSFIKVTDEINKKSVRHKFVKEEDNLNRYLPIYGTMQAKKIINEIHFEEFSFNVIKFIQSGYDTHKIKEEPTVILFVYDEERKVFDKCKAFDVTEEFKRLGVV